MSYHEGTVEKRIRLYIHHNSSNGNCALFDQNVNACLCATHLQKRLLIVIAIDYSFQKNILIQIIFHPVHQCLVQIYTTL